jgi:hypothetical protein
MKVIPETYLMKVIPETRRVHWIRYLRFYYLFGEIKMTHIVLAVMILWLYSHPLYLYNPYLPLYL